MELNEKLARWAGFLPHEHSVGGDYWLTWLWPDGEIHYETPDFTVWEACEEWLVKLLREKHVTITILLEDMAYVKLSDWGGIYKGEAGTLPLALDLAVLNFIDATSDKGDE